MENRLPSLLPRISAFSRVGRVEPGSSSSWLGPHGGTTACPCRHHAGEWGGQKPAGMLLESLAVTVPLWGPECPEHDLPNGSKDNIGCVWSPSPVSKGWNPIHLKPSGAHLQMDNSFKSYLIHLQMASLFGLPRHTSPVRAQSRSACGCTCGTVTCCSSSPALEVEQYQGSTLLAVSFHSDNQPLTEEVHAPAAQGIHKVHLW